MWEALNLDKLLNFVILVQYMFLVIFGTYPLTSDSHDLTSIDVPIDPAKFNMLWSYFTWFSTSSWDKHFETWGLAIKTNQDRGTVHEKFFTNVCQSPAVVKNVVVWMSSDISPPKFLYRENQP